MKRLQYKNATTCVPDWCEEQIYCWPEDNTHSPQTYTLEKERSTDSYNTPRHCSSRDNSGPFHRRTSQLRCHDAHEVAWYIYTSCSIDNSLRGQGQAEDAFVGCAHHQYSEFVFRILFPDQRIAVVNPTKENKQITYNSILVVQGQSLYMLHSWSIYLLREAEQWQCENKTTMSDICTWGISVVTCYKLTCKSIFGISIGEINIKKMYIMLNINAMANETSNGPSIFIMQRKTKLVTRWQVWRKL